MASVLLSGMLCSGNAMGVDPNGDGTPSESPTTPVSDNGATPPTASTPLSGNGATPPPPSTPEKPKGGIGRGDNGNVTPLGNKPQINRKDDSESDSDDDGLLVPDAILLRANLFVPPAMPYAARPLRVYPNAATPVRNNPIVRPATPKKPKKYKRINNWHSCPHTPLSAKPNLESKKQALENPPQSGLPLPPQLFFLEAEHKDAINAWRYANRPKLFCSDTPIDPKRLDPIRRDLFYLFDDENKTLKPDQVFFLKEKYRDEIIKWIYANRTELFCSDLPIVPKSLDPIRWGY